MELVEDVTRAAEPLLASTLIGDGELEGLAEEVLDEKGGARRKEKLLETGIKSLDDALEGGLEGGGVVGVSGEVGAGGIEVSDVFTISSFLYPIRWDRFIIEYRDEREGYQVIQGD